MADYDAKLAWARKQTGALDAEIETFLDDQPISTRVEIDRERQCIMLYGVLDKAIPDHWSLVVGDIVHNMRSSLDYVAWALSMRNFAVKTLRELRSIQFPICVDSGEYLGGQRERRTKFVEDGARTIIDGLQPCNRSGGIGGHLHILNELANEDKHHKLVVAIMAAHLPMVSFQGFGAPIMQLASIEYESRSIHDDAPLSVIRFRDPIPDREVHVEPHPAGQICFDDSLPRPWSGLPAIKALQEIQDFIEREVFSPLEAGSFL